MVSATVSIDEPMLAAYSKAFAEYAAALGDQAGNAPLNAALQLCVSLRARTLQAGKRRKYVATKSLDITKPHYITWKKGVGKLARPLHRMHIQLKDRGLDFERYYYTEMRKTRNGWRGTPAVENADIREQMTIHRVDRKYGKYGPGGLAKKSWGWVMHALYSGKGDDPVYRRRKGDKRNPVDSTKESYFRRNGSGITIDGGVARVANHLDYIEAALKPGALQEAVGKVVSMMQKQITLAQNPQAAFLNGFVRGLGGGGPRRPRGADPMEWQRLFG